MQVSRSNTYLPLPSPRGCCPRPETLQPRARRRCTTYLVAHSLHRMVSLAQCRHGALLRTCARCSEPVKTSCVVLCSPPPWLRKADPNSRRSAALARASRRRPLVASATPTLRLLASPMVRKSARARRALKRQQRPPQVRRGGLCAQTPTEQPLAACCAAPPAVGGSANTRKRLQTSSRAPIVTGGPAARAPAPCRAALVRAAAECGGNLV
eukprot:365327-Chlamydomonas_euryale.AAC.11